LLQNYHYSLRNNSEDHSSQDFAHASDISLGLLTLPAP